jgi:hypothetical protein
LKVLDSGATSVPGRAHEVVSTCGARGTRQEGHEGREAQRAGRYRVELKRGPRVAHICWAGALTQHCNSCMGARTPERCLLASSLWSLALRQPPARPAPPPSPPTQTHTPITLRPVRPPGGAPPPATSPHPTPHLRRPARTTAIALQSMNGRAERAGRSQRSGRSSGHRTAGQPEFYVPASPGRPGCPVRGEQRATWSGDRTV